MVSDGLHSKRRAVYRPLFALLLLVLLAGCSDPTAKTAAAIQGQWQRVSEAGPGDPNELSLEYIEYRPDGVLLTLLRDESQGTFWLNSSAAYTVTSSSQLEVLGSCWRGWERYSCSRTYQIELAGDRLTIVGDNRAEYQRVGEVSQEIPPTLIPPFPTPAP